MNEWGFIGQDTFGALGKPATSNIFEKRRAMSKSRG